MRYSPQFLFAVVIILAACGKKNDHGDHHDHDEATDDNNPNEALYNQVQDIHMDAMGKLDDLIRLKTQLLEKIAKSPSMPADKKQELGKIISALDSANNAMMGWMHSWMRNPPDSTEVEKTREYFETQMEGIKKIRDLTNEAIEKAKDEVGKN